MPEDTPTPQPGALADAGCGMLLGCLLLLAGVIVSALGLLMLSSVK